MVLSRKRILPVIPLLDNNQHLFQTAGLRRPAYGPDYLRELASSRLDSIACCRAF
jgi:hypothetical protein